MGEQDVSDEFRRRVAERLAPTSTYADAERDIVDGLLSDVIEAVLAELKTDERPLTYPPPL